MPDAQTDGSATTPRSAAFSRGRTQRMGSIGDARWGIVLWALALAALIVGGALWLRFGT